MPSILPFPGSRHRRSWRPRPGSGRACATASCSISARPCPAIRPRPSCWTRWPAPRMSRAPASTPTSSACRNCAPRSPPTCPPTTAAPSLPEQVCITSGCNMAFSAAIMAMASAGDNVIVPVPYFFNHTMWLGMLGIEARYVPAMSPGSPWPRAADAAPLIDSRHPRHRAVLAQQPDRRHLSAGGDRVLLRSAQSSAASRW